MANKIKHQKFNYWPKVVSNTRELELKEITVRSIINGEVKEVKQAIIASDLIYNTTDTKIWVESLFASTDVLSDGTARLIRNIKTGGKIGYSSKITNIQDGNNCTWNPTGSLMMGQKDFVVKPFKINEEICPRDLANLLTDDYFQAGQPTTLPGFVETLWVDQTQAQLGATMNSIFWNGDTSGGSAPFNLIDGWLKQFANDYSSKNNIELVGSISTTTLTVTAASRGRDDINGSKRYLKPGDLIIGANVTAGTRVLAQLTGGDDWGVGTYTVSISQTATSAAIQANTVIEPYPVFQATQSGTTLTVTNVTRAIGGLRVGMTVSGVGFTTKVITALGTGTGGVGTYTMSASETVGTAVTCIAKYATFNTANIYEVFSDVFTSKPVPSDLLKKVKASFYIKAPSSVRDLLLFYSTQSILQVNNRGFVVSADGNSDSYLGMPIKYDSDLPEGVLVSTFQDNMIIGTDLESDLQNLRVWVDTMTGGNKSKMEAYWAFGVSYIYGQYITLY